METIIQISEVNSKDVNTSRGASTVYNVKAVDGKEFSTFKKDLGHAAGQLRGQWATVEYQEVQKGKYTNYYLDSVKPAEGNVQVFPNTGGIIGNGEPTTLSVSNGVVSHNITKLDDKSAQINRSVAFKAAVELVGAGVLSIDGLEDLDKLTNKLIPIVDGTYVSPREAETAPLETTNQSSGEPGAAEDDTKLLDF